MGNILSWLWPAPQGDFLVHVTTGDKLGAGTDANVWLEMRDCHGRKVGPFHLDGLLRNDFERRQRDTFAVAPGEAAADQKKGGKTPLGPIVEIEIWRDSAGLGDAWFVDLVEVERIRVPRRHHWFPVQRWLKPHQRYVFQEYDSMLPQLDPREGPREEELQEKRVAYQYKVNVPGGPAQVANLPKDETFSEEYFLNFALLKIVVGFQATFLNTVQKEWKKLDDLKAIYAETSDLSPPKSLDYWKDDSWFGMQRLVGVNANVIRLCTEIPEKFGVTEELVAPFLETLKLDEALQQKRLFIVDYSILEGVPCKTGIICSPIALFFRNSENVLMPVAIQLRQQKGPENPVFVPSDHEYTWLLVKMFFNNADVQYHQSLTHLGFTHLLMEGVCVCTHRHLSPSHPLFRLLAPHFLYLLAINTRGLQKLINPGGWVDRGMNVGYTGMMYLITSGISYWRMDLNGIINNDIKARGVDKDVLPFYPYRDDATEIFQAVRNYVARIVNHFYDSEEKLKGDYELREWRSELVREKGDGGVGILGVPGDPELGFSENGQLVDTLTSIIVTCSMAHAAANFGQYEEYSFLPNYPGMLLGSPPTTKDALTEEDIMQHIPNRRVVLDICQITKLLSMRGTNSLGDFEVQYAYDPVSVDSVGRLQHDLMKISQRIQKRNENAPYRYDYLDPSAVPNAISV